MNPIALTNPVSQAKTTAVLALQTKRIGSSQNLLAYTEGNQLWLARPNGAQAQRVPLPEQVQHISVLRFSLDGRHLFVATGGRILIRIEIATSKQNIIKTLNPVSDLDVTSTGVVYSYGKQLHTVNLQTGRESRLITSPRLFPDGGASMLRWTGCKTWTVDPVLEPGYLLAA